MSNNECIGVDCSISWHKVFTPVVLRDVAQLSDAVLLDLCRQRVGDGPDVSRP